MYSKIKYLIICHTALPLAWRGLVVSSLPATEETEATGREIESRQGIGW
jgi:hypothetical protein